MKKWIACFLTIILCFCFSSCSIKTNPLKNKDEESGSLKVFSSGAIDKSINFESYPKTGNTAFCLTLCQKLFKKSFYISSDESLSLLTAYPKSSDEREALLKSLEKGETDIVFLEAGLDERLSREGLTFTPIGLASLCLVTLPENPVSDLSSRNTADIFSGKTVAWDEINGKRGKIVLPDMSRTNPTAYALSYILSGGKPAVSNSAMKGMFFSEMEDGENYPIEYTLYEYYAVGLTTDSRYGNSSKLLSVDGVTPNKQTIANGMYPLTVRVYAVIRSDEPKRSTAKIIADWLSENNDAHDTLMEAGIAFAK